MKDDHRFYSRLLSERPGLSVGEKESALKAVLEHVDREESPSRFRRFGVLPTAVKLAAFAGFALVTIPIVVILSGSPGEQGEEFLEKGALSEMPLFSIKCVDAAHIKDTAGFKNTCRPGDKIVFNVRPPTGQNHFSAFARRESDGLIIWYFPETEKGSSYALGAPSPNRILSKGVVIGKEYTSGQYKVYGIFSQKPTTREEIKSQFDEDYLLEDDNLRLKKGRDFTISIVQFSME